MINYSDNPKEYRRQYYLANKNKWKKYWKDATVRKTYIRGTSATGKAVYAYEKKHIDWNNKPKDYTSKWISEWKKRNNMKNRAYSHNRRAILGKRLTGKIIQQIYEDNIKLFGTLTCIWCRETISFKKATIEHKLAVCQGGTNDYENLGIACEHCNYSRGGKTRKDNFYE